MDILGPFTTRLHKCKFLIVGVDYFTKWIEAEAIPNIAGETILRFFKKNILARFGIPQVVVTDNGTQFTNRADKRASRIRKQSNPPRHSKAT
jgi:hypothetical protein